MEYHIIWGEEVEDVSVRTSGPASLEGLNAFVREALSDRRWRPRMRVLIDHRELDWTPMSTSDLRARVGSVVREGGRIGNAHVALVLSRPADYGVQRMMEAFADNWDNVMEVEFFFTVEEARAWLGRFPPPDAA